MVVVQVIGALDVMAARHHKDVAISAHHLDLSAVKPRKHWRGHHFVDSAQHGLAIAEIEHTIERTEEKSGAHTIATTTIAERAVTAGIPENGTIRSASNTSPPHPS